MSDNLKVINMFYSLNELIKRLFYERLQKKPSWGKNEVWVLFLDCFVEASTRVMDGWRVEPGEPKQAKLL